YTGTSRPTKLITLNPEYHGATLMGDGSSNSGTMTSDFCSGSGKMNVNVGICGGANDERNYYSWTTSEGSAQDYDVYVQYQVPSDFDGFTSSSAIGMYGWRTTSGEDVELSMYKDGALCGSTTDVATSNTTWTNTA